MADEVTPPRPCPTPTPSSVGGSSPRKMPIVLPRGSSVKVRQAAAKFESQPDATVVSAADRDDVGRLGEDRRESFLRVSPSGSSSGLPPLSPSPSRTASQWLVPSSSPISDGTQTPTTRLAPVDDDMPVSVSAADVDAPLSSPNHRQLDSGDTISNGDALEPYGSATTSYFPRQSATLDPLRISEDVTEFPHASDDDKGSHSAGLRHSPIQAVDGSDLWAEQPPLQADGHVSDDEPVTAKANGSLKVQPSQSLVQSVSVRKMASADELGVLAISARMTEADMLVQDLTLRLFQIQELRHAGIDAPSVNSGSSSRPTVLTTVDKALVELDQQIAVASKEMSGLQSALAPYSSHAKTQVSNETSFLIQKYTDLSKEWARVDANALRLREELREDAWLTVFRSAALQAEEMMESLEKILNQVVEFLAHVGRCRKGKGKSDEDGRVRTVEEEQEELDELDQRFTSLLKSFQAKRKYYVPSCEKVLTILDKGIGDRRTKNGEVLRRSGAMKARFKSIQERLVKTERELVNVETQLTNWDSLPPISSTRSGDHSTPAHSSVSSISLSTLLTPSPPQKAGISGSRNLSGSISPFRKLVKKITPSRPWTPSSTASESITTTRSAQGSSTRPPQSSFNKTIRRASGTGLMSLRRATSIADLSGELLSQASTLARKTHQRTPSLKPQSPDSSLDVVPQSNYATLRAKVANAKADLPPWNISLRRESKTEPLRRPAPTPITGPVGGSRMVGRPGSSLAHSSPAIGRTMNRAASPAASEGSVSTAFSGSYRVRPDQGTSTKIPKPNWTGNSPSRPQTPSAFSNMNYDVEEIAPSSLMQRALSPTPSNSAMSQSGYSVASTTAYSRSKIPLSTSPRSRSTTPASRFLGIPGSPDTGFPPSAPPSSFNGSVSGHGRAFSPTPSDIANMPRWNSGRSHTPEPNLALKAHRVTAMYRNTPSRTDSGRPASRLANQSRQGQQRSYEANLLDPLDEKILTLMKGQGFANSVTFERIDPPTSNQRAGIGEADQARYSFAGDKPMMCKIISRTPPGKKEKVERILIRVKGSWQDLELFLMEKQRAVEATIVA